MKLPYYAYRRQTALMAGVTWFVLLIFILWFEPEFVRDVPVRNSYLPFFMLVFAFFYWTLLSLTGRWKRSLLWTFITTAVIWLRINQLTSLINLGLLLSFGVIWEYYWRYLHPKPEKIKEAEKQAV
jgi:hypothetical protein